MWSAVLGCACIFVAGCRQLLDIEEGSVRAPVGHDEDGDGIDDGVDNCPATTNPSQDASEPGIGVACDRNPTDDGDRIALFLSFFPAGQPTSLDLAPAGTFLPDNAALSGTELRTQAKFAPSVVSADLMFGTFTPGSTAALAIADRRCRIESCGSRICVVATDGATTASKEFTPTGITVRLAMLQSETELSCVLTAEGTAASIALEESTADHVTVRVENGVVYVKSLTIYDIR